MCESRGFLASRGLGENSSEGAAANKVKGEERVGGKAEWGRGGATADPKEEDEGWSEGRGDVVGVVSSRVRSPNIWGER